MHQKDASRIPRVVTAMSLMCPLKVYELEMESQIHVLGAFGDGACGSDLVSALQEHRGSPSFADPRRLAPEPDSLVSMLNSILEPDMHSLQHLHLPHLRFSDFHNPT